jgi:hypothetical protein
MIDKEIEVLGEYLLQCHFVHHSTWPDQSSNPGRQGGMPATNCLVYGKAIWVLLLELVFIHEFRTKGKIFLWLESSLNEENWLVIALCYCVLRQKMTS